MDAVEFLKERKRLCEVYFEKTECKECPLENMGCWTVDFCADDSCEAVIATVEQWSKEHPRKTRQSVFLRVIPNLRLDKAGSIQLCPATITGERCEVYGAAYENCYDCRKNFWSQEVE